MLGARRGVGLAGELGNIMQWLSRAVLAAALLGCAVPKALAENETHGVGGAKTGCANDTDLAAFRTAAVQQQLMVAALTCKDVEAYNRFVLAYQPELEKSDADLKSYFARRGNVAEYDTFKTRLANLSSLSTIANGPAYCENAATAFDMALKSRQALSSFVADQRLMIAMPQQTVCTAPKSVPVRTAAAKPAPAPAAILPPLKVIAVRSAPVKPVPDESASPRVKLAAAEPPVAREAIVPAQDEPVRSFGGSSDPYEDRPQERYDDRIPDRYDDDLPLPPRPPRTAQASRLEAYYAAQYARAPRWGAASYYYPGR